MNMNREEILGMINWIQDLNNRLTPLIEELKDLKDECCDFDLFQLTDEERIVLPKSSKALEDTISSLYELNRLTYYHGGESLVGEVEDFVDGLYLQLENLYDYYEWFNEDGQIVCTLTYDDEADAWQAVNHITGVGNMVEYDDIRDMVVALETIHGSVSKIGGPIDEDGE